MEKRKESLSALKICRFCLTQNTPLSSIYDRTRTPKNSVNLPLKILSSVTIEVYPSDKMPSFICDRCRLFMDLFYEYKQICRQADETILQYIQNGTALETIEWPPSLVKTFRYLAKTSELESVKTVIKGGATLKVTTQEVSDSEDEDDANVYNIKIGDGSDEGSKSETACIKVVSNKDKLEITKEEQKQISKGFSSMPKLARHVRSHAGGKSYPCKYCDKSFVKSHHYTRHLRLKHRTAIRTARGPFGEPDQFRCEQCGDAFGTQDDLIYHSAIHATQNLTCPLCQEKFDDVDAVTAHIKSHVNGAEFMCEDCDLVFISSEKLENHIMVFHEEDVDNEQVLDRDESSLDMDAEDDEDDNDIEVKVDDHMVVEIKKAGDFIINNKTGNKTANTTNSEESEAETSYADLSTVDTLAIVNKNKNASEVAEKSSAKAAAPAANLPKTPIKNTDKNANNQTASIVRKAEEIKRKVQQNPVGASEKRDKPTKAEGSVIVGASDKSLRLLEKELQDLKRTNSRNDNVKETQKSIELSKNRRIQIHTSTPKRYIEERKSQATSKVLSTEKKQTERRLTKENKEPKENREAKANNGSIQEEREKETKEKDTSKDIAKDTSKDFSKDTSKSVIKNGASDKSAKEEGIRRSTRPSKIKDYAKMIREQSEDDDSDEDEDDEEYREPEKIVEHRGRGRPPLKSKAAAKPAPTPTPAPAGASAASGAATPRKRGRPRKDQPKDVPLKMKKISTEENDEDETKSENTKSEANKKEETSEKKSAADEENTSTAEESNNPGTSTPTNSMQKATAGEELVMSPTGQTLKKVPIRALPPGVKPLPLPVNARRPGEVCEMQIGKKVVKVQKIVMTKAEVEAMAKKGLVEMKDGTMVLKQGIKLPTVDSAATIKSALVREDTEKESPKEKAAPTRCDIDE